MKNIIKTTGVLIFSENKVLLVCHGEKAGHLNNTYGLPAGRIELEESPVQTAKRELKEETGLEVKLKNLKEIPIKYTASIERKDGNIKNYSQTNFLCLKYKGDLKTNEETVPEWIKLEKINELNLLPNVEKMILDSLKFKE